MPDPTNPGGKGIADLDMREIVTVTRPTLGALAPVAAFRALRLGGLETVAGPGLNRAVYLAGRRWAQSLTLASPADLFRTMAEMRLGVPKLLHQSSETIEIELAESLSAAGLPAVGQPLCHFEAGFLAGALSRLTGGRVQVRETACWGTGQQSCIFVAKLEPRS
ncbi:MAG TPA: V4R domain-containing protein [Chloroflexia bacterium]|nr:V4R domain-containing protein [Chloroflexia bacterium]